MFFAVAATPFAVLLQITTGKAADHRFVLLAALFELAILLLFFGAEASAPELAPEFAVLDEDLAVLLVDDVDAFEDAALKEEIFHFVGPDIAIGSGVAVHVFVLANEYLPDLRESPIREANPGNAGHADVFFGVALVFLSFVFPGLSLKGEQG